MTFRILVEDYHVILPLEQMRKHQEIIDYLMSVKSKYASSSNHIMRGVYFCLLAANHSKLGQYAEADKYFDIAFGASPYNFKIKLEMIDSYMQRGEIKKAEELLINLTENQRIEQSGLYRRFLLLSGRFFKLTGDYTSAIACFKEAQSRDTAPSSVAADIELMESFLSPTEKHFNRMSGCMEYGRHLFHIDRKAQPVTRLGITFMQNILHELNNPNDRIQALSALSQYFMEIGNLDEATKYNQQAIDIDANHPRSLAARIRLMLERGNKDMAMSFYGRDKVIILDDPRATIGLTRAFHLAGQNEIAQDLLDRLSERTRLPNDVIRSVGIVQSSINRQRYNQPA
jgi:tetratricopeptide (TPR) repeat protein